jgi:hypothetical protein
VSEPLPEEADYEEIPPWEEPGFVRLDCEPHRGPLLKWLGLGSLALGAASFFCLIPSVVAVPLGAAVWWMATQDLKKIDAGNMDPRGKKRTRAARQNGLVAVLLSLFSLGFWALIFLGTGL